MKDIKSAIDWLYQQTSQALRPGFERMEEALDRLGHPERQLPPVIQVTGTNGKGSTLAFLRGLLVSQGYRVGSFTSPHILSIHERWRLNHEPISDWDLVDLVQTMQELNEQLKEAGVGPLSGFELYTVMMIVYFSQAALDVCLLEVGIGGLWDCTNILDAQIAVVTTVGLDHQDRLGHRLEEIAEQKFGIVKPQTQSLLVGRLSPAALSQRPSVPISRQLGVDWEVQPSGRMQPLCPVWQVCLPSGQVLPEIRIQLLGDHQGDNLALALATFDQWMQFQGQTVDWLLALKALEAVRWPARLERVQDQPLVLLDGAHNQEGLMALLNFLKTSLVNKKVTLVFGGLRRKDQVQHLALLAQAQAEGIRVFYTDFDYPGAMTRADWEALPGAEGLAYVDWQSLCCDFQQAGESRQDQVLILTGSLYFASQVKTFYINNS